MTGNSVLLGDWGSTRLRLWLVRSGTVVARHECAGLLTAASPPQTVFEHALKALGPAAQGLRRAVLCGMAGARGGLAEAPYVRCPAGLNALRAAAVRLDLDGLEVTVVPGLMTRDPAGLPDVLRGEETQVFGALARDPGLAAADLTVVLPGTHSKWLNLRSGTVTGFTSAITGELFARLAGSSLFPLAAGDDAADAGFAAGLEQARRPGALAARLFAARTAQLCDGRSPGWASGFASGLLIGDEVAAMEPRIETRKLLVIGEDRLVARYRQALDPSGVEVSVMDANDCVIKGLEQFLDLV